MEKIVNTPGIQVKLDSKLQEQDGQDLITLQIEPLGQELHIEEYLEQRRIRKVFCSGDEKEDGCLCRYEWVESLYRQCVDHDVEFHFLKTGYQFEKDGKIYHISSRHQISQAQKAGLDYLPKRIKEGAGEMKDLFLRLGRSRFRSSFSLKEKDRKYIESRGIDTIREHAADFVRSRLAPAYIPNDGKQTPMKGHPVFLAQHATGTCCRGCLFQWHKIPPGRTLSPKEQEYVVDVIMEWINLQLNK